MDKIQIISLVVGSVVISAAVAGFINAWTMHLDRKYRRAETLLKAAMDHADWRLNIAKENADNLKIPARMLDKVVYTEQYYRMLDYLMKHGKLPKDANIQRE